MAEITRLIGACIMGLLIFTVGAIALGLMLNQRSKKRILFFWWVLVAIFGLVIFGLSLNSAFQVRVSKESPVLSYQKGESLLTPLFFLYEFTN